MRANILFDASSQAIHGLLAVVPPARMRAVHVPPREPAYAPVQTR
jgi:hypothetical protein